VGLLACVAGLAVSVIIWALAHHNGSTSMPERQDRRAWPARCSSAGERIVAFFSNPAPIADRVAALPAVECGLLIRCASRGVDVGRCRRRGARPVRRRMAAAATGVPRPPAALDATTRVDLSTAGYPNVRVPPGHAPVAVGLFALQVAASVLRREPGGLVRALVGVGKATIGVAVALGVTQAALVATDGICQAIAASAGTTVGEAASKAVSLSFLTGSQTAPMLQMALGFAVIVGCLLLWGVLLFRKAALILVAVFAPIAFAGAVFDHTRVWARRWIETVVALVLCKIVIVVVFVVGAAAFSGQGAGPGTGPGAQLSDLLVGLLLLSIAIFAPWLTWRFVHWSGVEAATAMHSAMTASPIPATARRAAGTATQLGQSAVLTTAMGPAGTAVGATASTASRRGPAARRWRRRERGDPWRVSPDVTVTAPARGPGPAARALPARPRRAAVAVGVACWRSTRRRGRLLAAALSG
jgi:hypothetical protein